MQGKLFHHAIDNSLLRGRIRKKAFFQAAEKSQKLSYDDMNRQVVILAKFTQSATFDNLIAISYRGIWDAFTDDDLKEPKPLSIQLAQQIQFISADRPIG